MAGALAKLLRNASGQMNHVGTDSLGIERWNENVEKVLSYFGIDASKDFTVNGIKYTKEGSRRVKSVAQNPQGKVQLFFCNQIKRWERCF